MFQYNHSSSYVATVLQLAQDYANGSATVPRTLDAVADQVDTQARAVPDRPVLARPALVARRHGHQDGQRAAAAPAATARHTCVV